MEVEALTKKPIKQSEAVPTPSNKDQQPKTVQLDPNTGPHGKASVKREKRVEEHEKKSKVASETKVF